MALELENIPRTVELIRSDGRSGGIPEGFPILVLLDQSKLPQIEGYLYLTDWRQVIEAIKALRVRGAPAIGIAGAAAVALRAAEFVYARSDDDRSDPDDFDRVFVIDEKPLDPELYLTGMEYAARMIEQARPTAVNLSWAVGQCMAIVREELASGSDPDLIAQCLFAFVESLIASDENANRAIGAQGAALLPDGASVLTHCNAGSLATAFYGTALGVIYTAFAQGKLNRVYADETRPVCQGSRLTAWELSKAHVPVTLLCDDMAATVMASGAVDAVVVGADRIARNGDVANKIGTLGLAILAQHYAIPFYVAAPLSSVDLSLSDGSKIPVEERDPAEVLPDPLPGVDVLNPAFDITPAHLITAIITEVGVIDPRRCATLDGMVHGS